MLSSKIVSKAAMVSSLLLVGLHSQAEQPMEEVVVTAQPIRDSQQAAITAKRDADNLLEVVAADTIGRFPDQNLADSLGRVPGMAIERDQGQARYINFRGMPFRYTAIGFNGIDVPGAENGRIPRFDSFPSVITRRLNVNKAVVPSMPGEAVAGYVDIQTFNPFDADGLSLSTDIGIGEQQLGGGDVDKLGARLSWSGENVGVLIYGSENTREQVTDNREYDLQRDGTGNLIVNQLQYRSYKVRREDQANGGHVEYRGDGNIERVFLSTLFSKFTDYEERNHYQFNFVAPVSGDTATNVPLYIDQLLEDGRYDNSTRTTTLGADLVAGGWKLEARYNLARTEFNTELPILYNSGVNFITRSPSLTTGSYDVSDIKDPLLTLSAPLNTYDYAALYAYKIDWPLNVDADKLRFDASHDLEFMGLSSVFRTGLMFEQREADGYVATLFDVFEFDRDRDFATTDPVNISSFDTGELWDSKTHNPIGATYFNNPALRRAWIASGGQLQVTPTEDQRVAISEDITALYAMMTSIFDWGNIVYGVRVERTDYTSKGTLNGAAVSVGDNFTTVLPSVHLNYNLRDDLKLRLSGSSGINRPTYIEWRAAAAVDPVNQTITGGNPTLEPEETWGADIALEWYFSPASLLSAGVFHRSIDNVIYTAVSTLDAGTYIPANQGQQWSYEGAVNGRDGSLSGFELNLIAHAADVLPEPFNGLGFSANMTLLNSEFKSLTGQKLDLPGTSDRVYNVSVFYEKYDVSLRVNYQYRDEWISPIEDPSEYWGAQKRVDMSVQYVLPVDVAGASITLFANANNLTNKTDVRYAGNDTINQSEAYGRRYLLGVRVNY
ncbi:MAG: TonB-dependent receptor [Pseudomonadales bacterium]|nr:TonB-dependent receptor [Pseudomonadales bacterium]